jgi:uncharacterized protein (UPF0261 family)
MFGLTTPCVNRVKKLLEREGFELLVFHATGTGGDAMEQPVMDGLIQGVLDITTTEFADSLVRGILPARPERLSAAGNMGIPQLVSVRALDMVNFGAPETVPPRFEGRTFYRHNPMTTRREDPGKIRVIAQRQLLEKARKTSSERSCIRCWLPHVVSHDASAMSSMNRV